MPYHLLGLISMTPALWVFLFAQLVLLVLAGTFCLLPVTSPAAPRRLFLGNIVALCLSVLVSALTVAWGFVQAFSAQGTDSEKAAQLATGILTIMNGFLMATPFTAAFGAFLWVQLRRRARQSGALHSQSS